MLGSVHRVTQNEQPPKVPRLDLRVGHHDQLQNRRGRQLGGRLVAVSLHRDYDAARKALLAGRGNAVYALAELGA